MVFVIAKTGMTVTFNYQGQGHFRKKDGRKYHIFIEKGLFFTYWYEMTSLLG